MLELSIIQPCNKAWPYLDVESALFDWAVLECSRNLCEQLFNLRSPLLRRRATSKLIGVKKLQQLLTAIGNRERALQLVATHPYRHPDIFHLASSRSLGTVPHFSGTKSSSTLCRCQGKSPDTRFDHSITRLRSTMPAKPIARLPPRIRRIPGGNSNRTSPVLVRTDIDAQALRM